MLAPLRIRPVGAMVCRAVVQPREEAEPTARQLLWPDTQLMLQLPQRRPLSATVEMLVKQQSEPSPWWTRIKPIGPSAGSLEARSDNTLLGQTHVCSFSPYAAAFVVQPLPQANGWLVQNLPVPSLLRSLRQCHWLPSANRGPHHNS